MIIQSNYKYGVIYFFLLIFPLILVFPPFFTILVFVVFIPT